MPRRRSKYGKLLGRPRKYKRTKQDLRARWRTLRNVNRKRDAAHALRGGVCEMCGGTEGGVQYHHIDPATKTIEVSRLYSYCWDRILAEIAKCVLLCHKHHVERDRLIGARSRRKKTPEREQFLEAAE